ncbi:hypothetical protein WCX18_08795 [Sulfurimonas sp. HSL1-2]|uniref:hypothetical protein n=1 Tax=Thiomicrolovo zhangzhouensis TaxID=3131933 RepID=UPI0031F92AED
MGGCGSSSSSSLKAPADIKAAIDINTSTAQNAIALVRSGVNIFSATESKLATTALMTKVKETKATLAAKLKDTTETGSETSTQDCDISGSTTLTSSHTYTQKDNGGWSYTETMAYSFNHCINGTPQSRQSINGKIMESMTYGYNADANLSEESYSVDYDYVVLYDSNETEASHSETWNAVVERTWNADGDYVTSATAPGEEQMLKAKGYLKMVDVNSSGEVESGFRQEIDITAGDMRLYDDTYWKEYANGFNSFYETSGGVEEFANGIYFKNFKIETHSDGADEENTTVSGTVGSSCLGGSVAFSTAPVMQSNQQTYFDEFDNHGGNVLPYAGMVTMKGNGTATVAFESNASNYTSATLVAPDGTSTYGSWGSLATGLCD